MTSSIDPPELSDRDADELATTLGRAEMKATGDEASVDQAVIESNTSKEESTVGTGTSIALGCIAGTLLLIVFGLIFIGIVAILD